jgi:hypothetical protein
MNNEILIEQFFRFILLGKKELAFQLTHNYRFFELTFDKHWDLFQKVIKNNSKCQPDGNIQVIKNFGVYQIFLNNTLLIEEDLIIENNKIKGTNGRIDCFGKLVFTNHIPRRVLTIRPVRNETLIEVTFLNISTICSIHKGSSYTEDGFYSCEFELENDDFLDKGATVLIKTDKREFVQNILLRGDNYAFHNINRPKYKGNSFILNNPPEKLHKIEVSLENGEVFSYKHPTEQHYSYSHDISTIFYFCEGSAFNYYYTY